jgi:hypothetical protein
VKRRNLQALAVGGACAVGCAAPLAVSLLSRSGSALLAGGAEWIAAIAATGLAIVLWRCLRTIPSSVASMSLGCGCSVSAQPTEPAQNHATPIACTLSAGEYKHRAARIRELAVQSLRFARRDDLRLALTYDRSASMEVRSLIRDEQACCSFLHFAIHEDEAGIRCVVVAPHEVREAANELFGHFAPELADAYQKFSPEEETAK